MTGLFIIGFILILGFGIALFLILGGHGFSPSRPLSALSYSGGQFMAPHNQDIRQRLFGGAPVQSGNLALNDENKAEAIEVYKQQIVMEEENRLYINNIGIAMIIIVSFVLLFLVLGSLAYYYFGAISYSSSNSQKVLYSILTLIPFGFLLISLFFAIKSYKLNYPLVIAPGFDKAFPQYGTEASVLALLKDEEAKTQYQLQKLIEQFNFILEVNHRKQSALSYAKMILLLGFLSTIPLLVVAVGNYFNVAW